MPPVQGFCREHFPHLFTAGPRTIANGGNYADSHSIAYSLTGLWKTLRIRRAGYEGLIVLLETFSDVAAVLASRTPDVTRHGFGSVRIDCDTYGVHLRQAVSDVPSCGPQSEE